MEVDPDSPRLWPEETVPLGADRKLKARIPRPQECGPFGSTVTETQRHLDPSTESAARAF